MSHFTRRSFAFSFFAAFASSAAFAQAGKQRRVRFPKGRTTAVLKGAVGSGAPDTYLLRAGRGQTMIVHVSSTGKNAGFDIFAPNGGGKLEGASGASDWTGALPANGDYAIDVYPTNGTATSYTLEVTIR
jgi:hypothetical protein